jgi:microcompartment protein CcmK/EutM
MDIVKVVGNAVSTVKEPRLEGRKLLLVREADQTGKAAGKPFIALDLVGAGMGELVFIVRGSSARTAAGDVNTPVDAAIVGILDSLLQDGKLTFRKE